MVSDWEEGGDLEFWRGETVLPFVPFLPLLPYFRFLPPGGKHGKNGKNVGTYVGTFSACFPPGGKKWKHGDNLPGWVVFWAVWYPDADEIQLHPHSHSFIVIWQSFVLVLLCMLLEEVTRAKGCNEAGSEEEASGIPGVRMAQDGVQPARNRYRQRP